MVVADVPAISEQYSPDGHTPTTLLTRVLVADVNAASMRALNYAQSLDADDIRAVFFATEPEEARKLEAAWLTAGTRVPLEVLEAPYRGRNTLASFAAGFAAGGLAWAGAFGYGVANLRTLLGKTLVRGVSLVSALLFLYFAVVVFTRGLRDLTN